MRQNRKQTEWLDPIRLKDLESTAVKAARAGGKILLKHFRKKLVVREKKGAGLVTNADVESQEKCISILKAKFSDFAFLTEEAQVQTASKARPQEKPGRWIIDPLDGTTNYVHGFPWFCVSIGAEWRGKMIAGVIYHPILDEIYTAVIGQGAKLNGKKICVSKTHRLSEALLATGFSYGAKANLPDEISTFEKLSRKSRAIRRPGAAALDFAYTARGVFDGFWERKLSPWDVAAGILIVSEAGGKVTDLQGNPITLEKGEILASNSRIHKKLLDTIVKV